MIKVGLKCSFMAQKTKTKQVRQSEKIKDVLTVKLWLP